MRGPWWKYVTDKDEKVRRCFVVAWGNIVKAPKERYDDLRSVKFVIKTGRGAGREEKYLVCAAYGERLTSVIMSALGKGDIVLVCGTWTENLKSKTKKGIKTTYECRVNFIVPFELIGYLLDMYGSKDIQKMVEDYRNEDADVWESDDDF